jgi:hypothetical protein
MDFPPRQDKRERDSSSCRSGICLDVLSFFYTSVTKKGRPSSMSVFSRLVREWYSLGNLLKTTAGISVCGAFMGGLWYHDKEHVALGALSGAAVSLTGPVSIPGICVVLPAYICVMGFKESRESRDENK